MRRARLLAAATWVPIVLSLLLGLGGDHPSGAESLPNPFFAFDNCLGGVKDAPRTLAEMGYAGLGTRGFRIAREVKAYREAGLRIFSTYVGCRLDATPPYDPAIQEGVKELEGTDVIFWLTVSGGRRGEEDEKAAAIVREIADLADTGKLRVALYPHTGDYVATTADALRLLARIGRKNVGVSINLCHELMNDRGARLEATIRESMPHLFLVSINGADSKRPGFGWDRLIQPLGRGNHDVEGFVRTLAAAGYRGPIGLQCYGVKGDPLESLRESLRAWKECSARLAAEAARRPPSATAKD